VSAGFSDGFNSGGIGGWSWDHRNYPVGGSDADCAQVDGSGQPAALLYVETIGGIAEAPAGSPRSAAAADGSSLPAVPLFAALAVGAALLLAAGLRYVKR
jgi:hypothetical protein